MPRNKVVKDIISHLKWVHLEMQKQVKKEDFLAAALARNPTPINIEESAAYGERFVESVLSKRS